MKVAGEYTFDAPQDIVWDALQDPQVLASVMPGCEKLDLIGENEYEGALKIKIGPVNGKFQGNVKLANINAPTGYDIEVSGKGAPGFVNGSGGLTLEGQGDKTLMTYQGDAKVGGRIASVGQRLVDSSAKSIIKQSLTALNVTLQARVAASAVSTAVGDVVDAGADAVSASTDAVSDAAGAGADVISGAVEAGADAVSGAVEAGADAVSDAVEAGAEAVDNVVQDGKAAVEGAVSGAVQDGKASVGDAVDAVKAAVPPVPVIPEVKAPSQAEFAANVAKDVASDLIPPQYRPLAIGVGVVIVLAILYMIFT